MTRAALWDHSRHLLNVRPVYMFGEWMLENFAPVVNDGIARGIAEVAYRFSPQYRASLEGNVRGVLRHTRPTLSASEIEREMRPLVHRIFWNRGVYFTDLSLLAGNRSLKNLIRFNTRGDWSPLTRHRAAGRGAILASAHLGNWHVGGVFVGSQGTPVSSVHYRDPATEFTDRRVARRGRVGQIFLGPDSFAMLEVVHALRRGEVVAMLGDKPWDSRWVEVPFFGRPSRFPLGPVRLARLADVPIFPAFCVWSRVREYTAILHEPIEVRGADPEEAEREALRKLARVYEVVVADHLPQWFNFTPVWDPE